MKYLIILLFPSICVAKEFHFTYLVETGRYLQKLEYKTKADTWKEAHARGADFCLDFFIDKAPLTEDRKYVLANACTNPNEN